jgi:beta-phosphoglucomutase-like phosphatase (HAD superfamily)
MITEQTQRTFWWDRGRPADAEVYPLRAVIFDLDALADIECDGHRVAFNAAFAAHGVDMEWGVDEYRRLLRIPDERVRIATGLRRRGLGTDDLLTDVLADEIASSKAMMFDELILDADVTPRSGLIDLVMEAFVTGVWVAVVTGGQRAWAEPLVRQLIGDGLVETVVTADDVVEPMPDPEVCRLALWELGIPAENALAIAGSAPALQTARSVGLATVAIGTDGRCDAASAVEVRASYDGTAGASPLSIARCRRLHGRWWATQKRAVQRSAVA